MSVSRASPSKISNPFSDWVCTSLRPPPRTAIMTAILIVEDDVLANEHLEFILQQAGYEVLSATSADEAAELLEDHEDVQLLLTDINLPGNMNGLKLAAMAKTRRPEMNIIIVTGYSAPKNDEIPPGSLFVPKPYNARKIIEAVRHFQ
jgi:two-component system, response regulator PdtaR